MNKILKVMLKVVDCVASKYLVTKNFFEENLKKKT